jgi:hypothetical protein
MTTICKGTNYDTTLRYAGIVQERLPKWGFRMKGSGFSWTSISPKYTVHYFVQVGKPNAGRGH